MNINNECFYEGRWEIQGTIEKGLNAKWLSDINDTHRLKSRTYLSLKVQMCTGITKKP